MNIRFWGVLGLLGLIFLLAILRVGFGGFTSTTRQPELELSKGLIAYWSFDDADIAGDITYDRSGQHHNGTLTEGLQTAVGKIGQALEFPGGTDRVETGSDFLSTKAITIAAWVYARSNGGLGHGRILDNGSTVLKIPNSERFAFSSDGMVTAASSGYGSLPLNVWIHVVVTRTSTGVANFYIDGVPSGTAHQNSGSPAAGTGSVSIGNGTAHDRTDVGWDGLIDDVRIYDRVFSADEISRLYNIGR
jgi:Concanavalin A-like lectin/glucanases superfamily